ncbi:hypothetical protein LC612_41710 [Nostoc sp. CHAB 5834]|nr:hypothetical protein [Nostoc sp. CHAB 5834]
MPTAASYASIEVSGGIRQIKRSPVSEIATSLEKRSLLQPLRWDAKTYIAVEASRARLFGTS